MADVVNIADHRKAPPEKPTLEELAVASIEEISSSWERHARNNRLNHFFTDNVPIMFGTLSGVNYLADLNGLSRIESKINLPLELFSPGSIGAEQLGWIAAFKLNGVQVRTPFMLSEAYARCFNILLFLKLGRELTQHGITIN